MCGRVGVPGGPRRRRFGRRGAATVELAVVTPILLAMVGGIIEYGYVFMAQSVLTNATREACRVATLPGSETADVETRFAEAVAVLGLTAQDYDLDILESGGASPSVTVQVRVPWSKVSLTGGMPVAMLNIFSPCGGQGASRSSDMFASSSMRKELST